jgi:hypothetical protein
MNLVRKRRRSGRMTVLPAAFWCFVLVIVTGCASDSTTSPGEDITIVVPGQGMDVPADDPEVIDKWIQQSGNAALIEAAGDSWIKPRETLSEYSYVRGAIHEVAIESDRVKKPAGLAASDTSLFVADNASGVISEYD